MSKMDKIKAQLDWLKIAFVSTLAIVVSLVSWLAGNATDPEKVFWTVMSVIGVFAGLIALILINRAAIRKMDELEEL